MSLENLKSMRGSSIDKLVKAAEAVSTPKAENTSYEDMIKIHEKVNFKNTLSTYYNIHHQIKFSERLMNHGFHRKLFLEQFKTFVRSNIDCFHY